MSMRRVIGQITRSRGFGALELMFVAALVALLGSVSVALASEWRGRTLGLSAARLVATQVRLARARAVRDGTHVALVFGRGRDGAVVFQSYRDGNGNGVRQAEVRGGVDVAMGDPVAPGDWFTGAAIAIPRDLPPIDTGADVTAGDNPVRLSGGGAILSCGPSGTTTSGTIYVAGARREAFAIRVLGATGRLRMFEYVPGSDQWVERW